MIKSFADRVTEQLFHRQRAAALPPDIQRVALRKLRLLTPPPASTACGCRPATGSRR